MWFVEEAAVRWQTPVATREIVGHGTDKLIYNSPALGCR